MIQLKFNNTVDAYNKAKELSKTNYYITVIQSIDGGINGNKTIFYVENKSEMIRTWEKRIHLWENGKKIKI